MGGLARVVCPKALRSTVSLAFQPRMDSNPRPRGSGLTGNDRRTPTIGPLSGRAGPVAVCSPRSSVDPRFGHEVLRQRRYRPRCCRSRTEIVDDRTDQIDSLQHDQTASDRAIGSAISPWHLVADSGLRFAIGPATKERGRGSSGGCRSVRPFEHPLHRSDLRASLVFGSNVLPRDGGARTYCPYLAEIGLRSRVSPKSASMASHATRIPGGAHPWATCERPGPRLRSASGATSIQRNAWTTTTSFRPNRDHRIEHHKDATSSVRMLCLSAMADRFT